MTTTHDTGNRSARTEPLLRPDQVAEILQVTPRTVRRWGAAGVLERVRIGSRLTRYRACDVAALINDEAPGRRTQGFAKESDDAARPTG